MPLHRTASDRIQRTCILCGRLFYSRTEEIRIGRGLYCTNACRGQALRGEHATNWQGGRSMQSNGYIRIRRPDHPDACAGYILEHRWLWEQAYGLLPEGCDLHHRNGDKTDNRIANLELLSHAEHAGLHARRPRKKRIQEKQD